MDCWKWVAKPNLALHAMGKEGSIAGLMIVLIADDAPHSASQIKWKYRPAVFCLSHVLYIHRLIIHKLSKEQ